MLIPARRLRGATLLELMVTVSIVAILMAVGMPSMKDWILRNSVSSAAEVLQNGLRRAESEAIRRNAPIEFLLTSGIPSSSASLTAEANAVNWAIRVVDSSNSYKPVAGGYVAGFYLKDISSAVTVSGPASVIFNGMARVLDNAGVPVNGYQVYRFSRSGSDKAYCVFVSQGGGVKMCDPDQASGTPRACQPLLSASQCPKAGSGS
ncbi:MAG TPA: GspH/FimT family pseudopilin [Rhodocyclaceae bacterium]|nr:GspH/FimT family pseudopilin [Rhodocyclaceae bacterium]HNO87399.1 GspH/FimT family pseudopilin [Rhodocyclaceae bacterium]